MIKFLANYIVVFFNASVLVGCMTILVVLIRFTGFIAYRALDNWQMVSYAGRNIVDYIKHRKEFKRWKEAREMGGDSNA